MADLGTLVVIVLKARNLTNKVRVGKQNPYATVTYGLTKKRTPAIVRGGQAPTWDHELHFSIPSTLQDFAGPGAAKVTATGGVGPGAGGATKPEVQAAAHMLKIACWADDARDPKLIGEAVVDLTEVLRKGEFDEWIPLAAKARPVGDVFIEMTFYRNAPPTEPAVRRRPNSSISAGYGVHTPLDDASGPSQSNAHRLSAAIPPGRTPSRGSFRAPSPTVPDTLAMGYYPDPDLGPLAQSMSSMQLQSHAYEQEYHAPPQHQPPPPPQPPQHQQQQEQQQQQSYGQQHAEDRPRYVDDGQRYAAAQEQRYPGNGLRYPENGQRYPAPEPRYPENGQRYSEQDQRYPVQDQRYSVQDQRYAEQKQGYPEQYPPQDAYTPASRQPYPVEQNHLPSMPLPLPPTPSGFQEVAHNFYEQQPDRNRPVQPTGSWSQPPPDNYAPPTSYGSPATYAPPAPYPSYAPPSNYPSTSYAGPNYAPAPMQPQPRIYSPIPTLPPPPPPELAEYLETTSYPYPLPPSSFHPGQQGGFVPQPSFHPDPYGDSPHPPLPPPPPMPPTFHQTGPQRGYNPYAGEREGWR